MLDDLARSARTLEARACVNPAFDLQDDPGEQRDLGTTTPGGDALLPHLLGQFLGEECPRWIEADQSTGAGLQQENTVIDPTLQQQLGASPAMAAHARRDLTAQRRRTLSKRDAALRGWPLRRACDELTAARRCAPAAERSATFDRRGSSRAMELRRDLYAICWDARGEAVVARDVDERVLMKRELDAARVSSRSRPPRRPHRATVGDEERAGVALMPCTRAQRRTQSCPAHARWRTTLVWEVRGPRRLQRSRAIHPVQGEARGSPFITRCARTAGSRQVIALIRQCAWTCIRAEAPMTDRDRDREGRAGFTRSGSRCPTAPLLYGAARTRSGDRRGAGGWSPRTRLADGGWPLRSAGSPRCASRRGRCSLRWGARGARRRARPAAESRPRRSARRSSSSLACASRSPLSDRLPRPDRTRGGSTQPRSTASRRSSATFTSTAPTDGCGTAASRSLRAPRMATILRAQRSRVAPRQASARAILCRLVAAAHDAPGDFVRFAYEWTPRAPGPGHVVYLPQLGADVVPRRCS